MDKFYFMSHHSSNDDEVTNIHNHLKEKNIETWVDHLALKAGDVWAKNIQQALNECQSGILVLSPAAADSRMIEGEIRHLMALNKPICVAVLENMPTENFPFYLGAFQYVDLTRDFAQGITRLAEGIQYRLPALPSRVTPGGYSTPLKLGQKWMKVILHVTTEYLLQPVNVIREYAQKKGLEIISELPDAIQQAKENLQNAIRHFENFLVRLLDIARDLLRITKLLPGSAIVEVWLPVEAAERLTEIAQTTPSALGINYENFSATLDTKLQLSASQVAALGVEIHPTLFIHPQHETVAQISNTLVAYPTAQLDNLQTYELEAYRGWLISVHEEKQNFLSQLLHGVLGLLTGNTEMQRARQDVANLNSLISRVNDIISHRNNFLR